MFLAIKLYLNLNLHTYAKLNCLKWNCFDIETELLYIEQFWDLTV